MTETLAPLRSVPLDASLAALLAVATEELTQHPSPVTSCRVILLEGLDGVGKSAVSAALAQRLGAHVLRTPPPELAQHRGAFDGETEPVRRAFYMLGNVLVSRALRLAHKDDIIVLDRYWPSTFAYGTATRLKREGISPDSIDARWPAFLIRPTVIAVLTLSEANRRERLKARGVAETAEEAELAQQLDFRSLVLRIYSLIPGVRLVDAAASVQEIVSTVAAL